MLSSKTQSYPGVVEKGKFIPDDPLAYSQRFYPHEGKRVLESVQRQRKPRSNQQNKYLWGVPYKIISDYLGYSRETIHDMMRYKFHFEIKNVGGEKFKILLSTTKMSTTEFNEYNKKIQQWASEFLNGLYIPDPNEVPIELYIDR